MSLGLIQISAWNDSGGGFLHRLFDGHGELDVWPFELLLGTDAFRDGLTPAWFHGRFRWPRLEPLLALGAAEQAFEAISDRELKGLLSDPGSSRHRDFPVAVALDDWRSGTCARWRAAGDVSQRAFLTAYLETFLRLWRPQAPAASRPLLGHCPVGIMDFDRLTRDFPDARVVHVVRNPLAGFRDMRARHPDLDPSRYAEKWGLVNSTAALWQAREPDRVRLVTLASLLEDREATMARLCDFLRIGWDPVVLAPHWCGVPVAETGMGPFGGVPDVSIGRESLLSRAGDDPGCPLIAGLTAGTIAMLDRLGHDTAPLRSGALIV